MNTVPTEYVASGGISPVVLSAIHAVILTLILIGLFRVRSWLIFANIVIGLVAAFFLFLLIDGLISGPLSAEAGLICGAALTLACVALRRRTHHGRHQAG
jgi:Na+-transporting NADH:ubiquinone oxidoreductase subunit NqrB